MKEFSSDRKTKLSQFLLAEYDGALSFANLNKLFRKKDVKVNGKRVSKDCAIEKGDVITVYFDGSKPEIKFDTLYSDDNILVAVKPKGVTSEDFFKTVQNECGKTFFCHRLDRNTDGVMIFARNENAYSEILEGFKKRTFKKFYHAVVFGIFRDKSGIFSDYLIKDADEKTVRIINKRTENSKPVKTGYTVVMENERLSASLLSVELFTGRTHQIRAHLASKGHFVLGDGKYGKQKVNDSLKIKDMLLSSYRLTICFNRSSKLFYLNGKTFEFGDSSYDFALSHGFKSIENLL